MAIFNTIMPTPTKKKVVRIPLEMREQIEKDLGTKIPREISKGKIDSFFDRILPRALAA